MLLLARTDACRSRGFEEALARFQKFAADGADILFLDSPGTQEQMHRFVAAAGGKPTVSVTTPAGKYYMLDDATLAAHGIKFAIYPQGILAAAVQAMRAVLAGLRNSPRAPMASAAGLASAIRMDDHLAEDDRLTR